MSDGRTVEFAGERFAVAEKIGLMPLMRFAKLAQDGVDSEDMSALTAMYDVLEQAIADEDWERFQQAAIRSRADGEDLMGVVGKAIEAMTERPTSRPSDSSDGPRRIEPRSEDVSYLRVVEREEAAGRPDRALMVQMAQEARSAV